MAFAEKTSVPVDKSRADVEATLRRYGASMFFSGWDEHEGKAFIAFKMTDRHVKLTMPLPRRDDPEITTYKDQWGRKKDRTTASAAAEYDQRLRSRFRSLLLVVKAKLESVEAKIETFEQAFLAHIVLPDNTLVGDRMKAILDDAYRTGKIGLPAPGESEVHDA